MPEFDGVELMRWAHTYGHPEEWAKKAQAAWGLAEDRLIENKQLQRQRDELLTQHSRLVRELQAWRPAVEWLADLDKPWNAGKRRTVTLEQIIDRAREARDQVAAAQRTTTDGTER